MAKRKKVIKKDDIERDDNTSMAYRRDEMKKKASGVMPYEEDKEYCSCDCDCGKKVCESCKLEKRPEDVKEGFRHYNVTHKKTGKKYRVTAMHDKSARDKARRMHGGTASRYSGTSTDDFHVEDVDAIQQARREAEAEKIKKLFGEACYKHNGSKKKVSEEEKFEPHMMYDPKTGKGYKAETEADHIKYKKMGYTHEKPDVNEISTATKDSYYNKAKKDLGRQRDKYFRPFDDSPEGAKDRAEIRRKVKNRKAGLERAAEDSDWPRPFSKSERDDFLKKKRVPGDNVKHQMRPKGVSAGEAGKRKLAKVAQGDKNRKLAKESAVASIPKKDWEKARNRKPTRGIIIIDKGKTHSYKWKKGPDGKPLEGQKDDSTKKRIKDFVSKKSMKEGYVIENKDTHITKDGKKAKKGLWYYINKKKESGKAKAKPGDKDYPSKKAFKMASENEEYMNEFFNKAVQNLIEKSAAEVLKKRYASDHADDNPQATKRIKDHIPGMKTYKMHPGAKFQKSTGTYSKKGKMAALKKQHARRPEQYGITREEDAMQEDIKKAAKIPFKKEYKQGNYSGAHKEIVKKYGEKTVKHPKVQNALRTANEDKTELLKKVIERSMDLTPSKIEFKTFNEVAGQRGRPKRGEGRDSEGHIIMQLRSAQDLKGNKDIKFRRGVAKVKPQHIDKILKVHDHPTMKPIMKRKLRVAISKSHNDLVRVANKVK
tara:strand:+ start:4519 stop:6648 length:2130 start_codon:yes stop_codon:yes gene_type:complete